MALDVAGKAVAKFLEYYREIQRIHLESTGKKLKGYKPTEPDRLGAVFEAVLALESDGLERLTEFLHRVIWSQCLGNGNHRTTVLFLQAFLDSFGVRLPHTVDDPPGSDFRSRLNRFTEVSHEYLDRQNEWGYGPREFETRHREHCRRWLDEMLGPQSALVATIGPQRLMTFLS